MGTRQLLKTQIVSQVHRNQAEEKETSNVGGDSGAPLCLSIWEEYWGSSKITKDWIVTACSNFGIICSVDMTGAAIFPSHHVRGSHWDSSDQSEARLGVIWPIRGHLLVPATPLDWDGRYLPILGCDHHYTGNNKSLIPVIDHNNLRPQWHLPCGPSLLSYLRCLKLNCLVITATLSLPNLLPIGHTLHTLHYTQASP